jgi:hypothetical protein
MRCGFGVHHGILRGEKEDDGKRSDSPETPGSPPRDSASAWFHLDTSLIVASSSSPQCIFLLCGLYEPAAVFIGGRW